MKTNESGDENRTYFANYTKRNVNKTVQCLINMTICSGELEPNNISL